MKNDFSPVTLGKTLRSRVVGAFTITDTLHSPNTRLVRHFHKNTCLQIVMNGFFLEQYNQGKAVECEVFSFLIKPPGEPHSNLVGTISEHSLIIEFDDSLLEEWLEHKILRQRLHIRNSSIHYLSLNLYKELKKNDTASKLATEGIIMEIIAHLSRHSECVYETKFPSWLHQVRDYLHDNYTDSISLSTLARLVDINAAHLCRVFRKYLGCSLGDYLREVRVKNAIEKLSITEQSLGEIAIECGFYDQSHLSRYFKLKTGMSPNQFRRMLRNSVKQT